MMLKGGLVLQTCLIENLDRDESDRTLLILTTQIVGWIKHPAICSASLLKRSWLDMLANYQGKAGHFLVISLIWQLALLWYLANLSQIPAK